MTALDTVVPFQQVEHIAASRVIIGLLNVSRLHGWINKEEPGFCAFMRKHRACPPSRGGPTCWTQSVLGVQVLVGVDGHVVGTWRSLTAPMSRSITKAIEAELAKME